MQDVANRYETHEQRDRNIDPYYRKFQKIMYGGRVWMNVILALGTIDELIVENMNDIVCERSLAAPLQQRREHQKPAFLRGPRVKVGIDHRLSIGKTLRGKAKELDRKIQQAEEDWREGRGRQYSWPEWMALLDERNRKWDEAICSTPPPPCPCLNAGLLRTQWPLHQRRVWEEITYFQSEVGFGIFVGWGAWVSGRVGGWITKTAFASTQGLYFWCRICNKT